MMDTSLVWWCGHLVWWIIGFQRDQASLCPRFKGYLSGVVSLDNLLCWLLIWFQSDNDTVMAYTRQGWHKVIMVHLILDMAELATCNFQQCTFQKCKTSWWVLWTFGSESVHPVMRQLYYHSLCGSYGFVLQEEAGQICLQSEGSNCGCRVITNVCLPFINNIA